MNVKCGGITGILVVVLTTCVELARGDDPPALDAGFRAHVVNQKGGGIDWTSGEIIAEGFGKGRGNRAADRVGAQRAATLVAARNALAIANGIQFDGNGRVGNVRDGQITLDGVVKGQRVVGTTWDKSKTPVECRVKLSVPLWGVTGVCTVFADAQRRSAAVHGGRRLSLVEAKADVSDVVLVIDARGRKIDPCLFPVVKSADGAVLYDIATRTDPLARSQPPVRFVESDMTFERLRACLEAPARWTVDDVRIADADHDGWRGGRFLHAFQGRTTVMLMFAPAPNLNGPASQPTTTGPTSQATSRPTRRRVVVKAAAPIGGKSPSRIVLTKEDAEKLRQSPEGANLLRGGKVIVVVDSAAAGMQGFCPRRRRHLCIVDSMMMDHPDSATDYLRDRPVLTPRARGRGPARAAGAGTGARAATQTGFGDSNMPPSIGALPPLVRAVRRRTSLLSRSTRPAANISNVPIKCLIFASPSPQPSTICPKPAPRSSASTCISPIVPTTPPTHVSPNQLPTPTSFSRWLIPAGAPSGRIPFSSRPLPPKETFRSSLIPMGCCAGCRRGCTWMSPQRAGASHACHTFH